MHLHKCRYALNGKQRLVSSALEVAHGTSMKYRRSLFLLAGASFAQQQTAPLIGQVTDSSGAAVPGMQTSLPGRVITDQTVEDCSFNGRNTFCLIALTPRRNISQFAYVQFGDVTINATWDTNFSINCGCALDHYKEIFRK